LSSNVSLKEPSSIFGYRLQLLEPWGHLRCLEEIEMKDFPYEKLGIKGAGKVQLQEIMKEGKIALEDIQRSLEIQAKKWKDWTNIRRIVSHKGLGQNITYVIFCNAQTVAQNVDYIQHFPLITLNIGTF
jgi:hypothetical protein